MKSASVVFGFAIVAWGVLWAGGAVAGDVGRAEDRVADDRPGATRDGLRVVAYDGYGTPHRFQITGRVLAESQSTESAGKDSSLANVLRTVRAMNSHEVPDVELSVTVGGQSYSATSDADGMFRVRVLNLPETQALAVGPVPVAIGVVGVDAVTTTGTIHVAPAANAVGVISDIDDTVVQTFVPDKVKMIGEVFTKNAATLSPVAGAAPAYKRAREAGVDAVFYVSGSPVNLYSRLTAFLRRHDYPPGALFLKNLGQDSLFSHDTYKLGRLRGIADDNPGMAFILVGDSGERDPEIYQAFRSSHPERVLGIVIRKVPGSKHLEPARFAGMVTVNDAFDGDSTIAALVPASHKRPAPSPAQDTVAGATPLDDERPRASTSKSR
jgi:phosphatidate phosphatase APP1